MPKSWRRAGADPPLASLIAVRCRKYVTAGGPPDQTLAPWPQTNGLDRPAGQQSDIRRIVSIGVFAGFKNGSPKLNFGFPYKQQGGRPGIAENKFSDLT